MVMNHLTVTNRQQFRAWLAMHNQDASECWVDVKRGIPKADGTFWYVDRQYLQETGARSTGVTKVCSAAAGKCVVRVK